MPKKRLMGMPRPVAYAVIVLLIGMFILSFIAGPMGSQMFGLTMPDWMVVQKPEVEFAGHTVFHLFGFPIANSVIAAWISITVLVLFSWAATRRMKIIPGRLQMAFEFLLGWIYDFSIGAVGEKNGRRFFPVVATIFLFVAFNAWLALLPGYGTILVGSEYGSVHLLKPANTDINTPLAIALVSVAATLFYGFKSLRFEYLEKFFAFRTFFRGAGMVFKGKIGSGFSEMFTGIIEIVVGFLELTEVFIHIISFTARLFGNMTAGEILLMVAAFLIPWLFALPFYSLELLVGFLQALIFAGLTLIFMNMAVSRHAEEENH